MKCNGDGAYNHNLLPAVYVEIFHNNHGKFLLAFTDQVAWSSSYLVEFYAVIRAMEIAIERVGSSIMVQDFHKPSLLL